MEKKDQKKSNLTSIPITEKESLKEKALRLGNDEVIAKAIQNLLRKDTLH